MNHIHPTAVIGEHVRLGTGNRIGPYAVIVGDVEIGDDNWLGPHVCIGTPGEVYGVEHAAVWAGEVAGKAIRIGHRNVIREFITVQAGHYDETVIGDECYLMNKTHVAHDCVLGNRVTLSTGVILGGHTHVGDGANLGLNSVTHQRTIIGPGVMLGMGSIVTKPIPPHAKAFGSPARVKGANTVGLQRKGFSDTDISAIEAHYAQSDTVMDAALSGALAADLEWWTREVG